MKLAYKDKIRQVGLNISYYRRYRNLTQMELAEKVNISSCYLSQIERGLVKNAVSLPVLIAIADSLNIELADLFKFQNVPKSNETEG
ncbi:MAG: helix-turn-helix transcriptional regulator [Negativicutes bacterium]|nr:helix-turn-helix transcriptional regulator [Negativicutes bacterium]